MVNSRSTNWLEVVVVALLAGMLLAAGVARGDDDRARKAKVALALAGADRPTVAAAAPAPRPAAKIPYADGYRRATVEQLPLVVFVGCDGRKPDGAISSKADGPFAGVAGPAVVVGYPRGDRLWIDATLPSPTETDVQKAVDAARRKIDAVPQPKAMPAAPKPLDWQIRGPIASEKCDT